MRVQIVHDQDDDRHFRINLISKNLTNWPDRSWFDVSHADASFSRQRFHPHEHVGGAAAFILAVVFGGAARLALGAASLTSPINCSPASSIHTTAVVRVERTMIDLQDIFIAATNPADGAGGQHNEPFFSHGLTVCLRRLTHGFMREGSDLDPGPPIRSANKRKVQGAWPFGSALQVIATSMGFRFAVEPLLQCASYSLEPWDSRSPPNLLRRTVGEPAQPSLPAAQHVDNLGIRLGGTTLQGDCTLS